MASDSYYISKKNEKAMQRNPNKLDTKWTYLVSILIICGSVIWLFYKDIGNLWAILGIIGGVLVIFNLKKIKIREDINNKAKEVISRLFEDDKINKNKTEISNIASKITNVIEVDDKDYE